MKNALPAAQSRNSDFGADLDAWIPLYESKLLKLAFGILGDLHLAQDCVQEAFIRAGLKAPQLEDPSKVSSWLAKIVVNECRKQLKTRWFRKVLKGDVPETGYVHQEPKDLSNVHLAVKKLPERQRIAVSLYYFQDLPLRDVANIMGVREGTCKAILHDARRKLQFILEEEER